MDWSAFLLTLKNTHETFSTIIDDLGSSLPEQKSFLKKSSLIIGHQAKQYAFGLTPTALDMTKCLALIESSPLRDSLEKVSAQLKGAELGKKTARPGSKEYKDADISIARLRVEIASLPLEGLSLVDNFTIEIRFPSVRADAIAAVKAHPLVHKDKNCPCRACINVILF